MNFFRKTKLFFKGPDRNETEQSPEGTWSIGIYTGTSPFDLRPPENLKNPVLTAEDVTDIPADFVADPFMLRQGSTWHMFFEVLNAVNNLGTIAFATSEDAFNWRYGAVVLAEPFSLSYPYVFRWEGEFYMIPECNETRSVRLYRADDFPSGWKLHRILKKRQRFSDSSLFRHNDHWWMFTATRSRPRNNGRLRLYHADRLEGQWTEHPRSPVVKNNPHIARPGGRPLILGNDIIRYAQDDFPIYGRQVWAFRIKHLTTTGYEEEPVSESPILTGTGTGWNAVGMHTVDPHHQDGDRWIACVDGFGEI